MDSRPLRHKTIGNSRFQRDKTVICRYFQLIMRKVIPSTLRRIDRFDPDFPAAALLIRNSRDLYLVFDLTLPFINQGLAA
jgi:hypothetical protein